MENTTESKVAIECAAGNWRNFESLYDEYLPKIYRYVFYRIRHKQTAEDLTSTIFYKVVSGFKNYKPDNGIFAAWIYRIARNTVIDHVRAEKPTADLDQALNVPSSENVLDATDTALKLQAVKTGISSLNATQQEIVMLRVWEGLAYKEISQIMDISEDNAKVNFSRAVEKLKSIIPLAILLLIICGGFI